MREVTPPTAEPLTLTEVRVHLRQMGDASTDPEASPTTFEELLDDSWVTAKITAARQWAEAYLGYPITDAVYVQTLDAFDTSVEFPEFAAHIASIQYVDTDNVLQTLDPGDYEVDEFNRLIYIEEPVTELSTRANPVRVMFQGIYGGPEDDDDPPLAVPESVKHAMLLMIGHWYENREASLVGGSAIELPMGSEYLLRPSRTRLGMA